MAHQLEHYSGDGCVCYCDECWQPAKPGDRLGACTCSGCSCHRAAVRQFGKTVAPHTPTSKTQLRFPPKVRELPKLR